MKRTLLSLLFIITFTFASRAQYVDIPDQFFGGYLNSNLGLSNCMQYTGSYWRLDTTCPDISAVTNIDLRFSSNVSNILGVEYFHNLLELSLPANGGVSLPTNFPPHLTYIDMSGSHISSLPSLPLSVDTFICHSNFLQGLIHIPSNLTYFDCSGNFLGTSFYPQPVFDSFPNNMTDLIIDDMPDLWSLPSHLPDSLRTFVCTHTSLGGLPLLPPHLEHLDCQRNFIFVGLPTLPSSLRYLDCSFLYSLTCLPAIPPSLDYFDFTNSSQLSCMPNRFHVTTFAPSDPNLLPLCAPGSGCDFFYNINGNTHLDVETTCAADSLNNGSAISGLKMLLKQNGQVIKQTYSQGQYSFKTDTVGQYTVSADTANPMLVVACPGSNSRSVSITATDSVVYGQNFGLQCRGVDNGVRSIYSRFRNGQQSIISIIAGDMGRPYGLTCSNHSSGTVTTSISGPATYYTVAPGALIPSSIAGNTLTYNISDFDVVNIHDFDISVHVNGRAPRGSHVCITTTISTAGGDIDGSNDQLTQCFPVQWDSVSPYDPNEKVVYPDTVAASGGWETYTIYFQNIGTGPSQNVIIKDTLSSDLDASTFQMLDASFSPTYTNLTGPAVSFEMYNIYLSDSASDPVGSMGYVHFKVRSRANLAVGTTISNNASVYFDSQPAVVTNTANVYITIPACSTVYQTLNDTVCSGSSVAVGTHIHSATGTYTDTIALSGGCDSIVTLYLTVKPLSIDTISQSICAGGSYTFGGNTYSAAGYYSQTYTGVNGCDSTSTLHLMVTPATYDTLRLSICDGDMVMVGSHMYMTGGIFQDTLTASTTCDSIVTLYLTVKPLSYDTLSQSICSGDSVVFGGTAYYASGYYSHTLTGVNGCDSTSTLHLTVKLPTDSTIYQTICAGDSFLFAGSYYHTSGFRTHVYTGVNGCDSLLILSLTVNPLQHDTISQSICSGDSIIFGGTAYRTAGYYSHTNGCDSIVTLKLSLKNPGINYVAQTICHGTSFIFRGYSYDSTGIYKDTLRGMAASGCDSIISVNIYSNYESKFLGYDTICAGSGYAFKDSVYYHSGICTYTTDHPGTCDTGYYFNLYIDTPSVIVVRHGDTLIGGSLAHSYQWLRDGHAISGSTGAQYIAVQGGSYSLAMRDIHGCDDTSAAILVSGVGQLSNSSYIHLYPNPNSGSFTLETTQQIGEEYQIYDMLGQLIQQRSITADVQKIDMSDVAPAVYTLTIKGKAGSTRFTVMR